MLTTACPRGAHEPAHRSAPSISSVSRLLGSARRSSFHGSAGAVALELLRLRLVMRRSMRSRRICRYALSAHSAAGSVAVVIVAAGPR